MASGYEPQPTGLEGLSDEELIDYHRELIEVVRQGHVDLQVSRWEWQRRQRNRKMSVPSDMVEP